MNEVHYQLLGDKWYMMDTVAGPFDTLEELIAAHARLLEAFDHLLEDLRKRLDEPES